MPESTEPLKTEKLSGRYRVAMPDSGQMKKEVFILLGHYLPGFKVGGPIRSISNLVSALGNEFDFKVITMDRDLGDELPYPGISANRWIRVGNADVMYLAPGWLGILKLIALLRSVDHSAVLYLNGIFSRRFSMLAIFLRRLGLIHPGSLVIAPRGEFSPGALQLKMGRKMWYLRLSRWLGLYRGVIWHESSELEAANTLSWFGGVGTINIAPVISQDSNSQTLQSLKQQSQTDGNTRALKAVGHLRVVFISRISPKKNVLCALRMLQGVSGDVAFDIYGPIEDSEYWSECKKEISSLPHNIHVKYCGEVAHDRVFGVFTSYDLFLFPTLGENYGHVICEALGAGCPVLISDQTPWRELQSAGVGWDVPIDNTDHFRAILQQCVAADEESYGPMRAKAMEFAKKRAADPGIVDANRALFEKAIAGTRINVSRPL